MANTQEKPLAVVTGASSGIGLALAKQFAEHGFDLVIAAEDDGIVDAADDIEEMGADVTPVQTDLASYEGVERLCASIQADGRPVEVLALNAGVGVAGDFARETSLGDELNLLRLNVLSPVHLAKRVLPEMTSRKHGRVLITASIAGTMPTPLEATYGASKAFLLSFAEALRNELEDTGVTVTALAPGPTDTNFFHRAGLDDTKVAERAKKTSADEVAEEAFDALMAGKERVVAGSIQTKVEGAAARFVPEKTKAKMHRKQSEPGSAKR